MSSLRPTKFGVEELDDHGNVVRTFTDRRDGSVGITGNDGSLIHRAARTMTHAQLLAALNAPAPFEVIPAPRPNDPDGTGLALSYISGRILCNFVAPYTNAGGSNAGLYFAFVGGGAEGDLVSANTSLIILTSANTVAVQELPAVGSIRSHVPDGWGIGLTVFSDGVFGGGSVLNILTLLMEFFVLDLSQKKLLTTAESGWDAETRSFR
jgi:hypothetical protein